MQVHMARTAVASLLFSCLLLLAHLGHSYHTSFSQESRRWVVRPSRRARTLHETTCSSILPGEANGNRIPLFHRSRPCSPLNRGADKPNRAPPSTDDDDIFHRDARRLGTIFAAVQSGMHDTGIAAPAPAPAAPGVTAPVTVRGAPVVTDGLDYTVMVGYGTPAQQLPMEFDTLHISGGSGASALRCKPCLSRAEPCDPAFDPARSSSFAWVPCGPECPSACHGSTTTCSLNVTGPDGVLVVSGTLVEDTLTLPPSSSATFTSFVLACMDADGIHHPNKSGTDAAGVLDLGRGRFSLVSRVASSSSSDNATIGFSYCLPASTTSTRGFLTVGGALPDLPSGSTPLVELPRFRNTYLIELGGINVGRTELPPPAPQSSLATLDVGTSFTFLRPDIYTALRDEFRKQMARYPVAPPYRALDTCYNFTGLPEIEVPAIQLEFKGGVTLMPADMGQMMYFLPGQPSSVAVGCLAFAATPGEFGFSVIGNMAQQTLEVVYDVRGGKVGFIQQSC